MLLLLIRPLGGSPSSPELSGEAAGRSELLHSAEDRVKAEQLKL